MDDFKKGLRIGVLDIEASGLDADFGYLICACVKEVLPDNLKGRIETVRIDDAQNPDPKSDKWAVRSLIRIMDSYDVIVHWYGSMFDVPFINTRALKHGLRPPQKNYRRDLCMVARGVGRLKSNHLATWGRYLFGKSGKSFLDPKVWIAAIRNEKWALDYVVDHCQKDVIETERIYKKFLPLLGRLRKR